MIGAEEGESVEEEAEAVEQSEEDIELAKVGMAE
jgi:hypothetical protein